MRRCYLFVVLSVLACASQANTERTKDDLNQVQEQLKNTNKTFKEQQALLDKTEKDLKKADLAIAESSKKLKQLKFDVELNLTEQATLKDKIKSLEIDKKNQQSALAAQLRSAFMTGNHDYGKLLLSQDQVQNVERTLNYYQYLNNARIKELEKLKTTLIELENSRQLLAQNQTQLEELLNTQQQQQEKLVVAKKEQKANYQSLKSTLQKTQSQLVYLKQNEQVLKQTLEQLNQELIESEVKLIGLQKQKGKLDWPSHGKLAHRFGQKKHGSLRWKGVLMNGKEGAPVKTIADGQVLFADWLKGFGWVIVIDHGKGFMSLYGHSQALLKEVGDKVRAGEQIALVGQSGGQSNPSLYFEIRHKGRAVNPIKWCRRI
ncbi:murein hydrolase activator EnvC family protein [Pseudoalteromonas spongiae]|uniref:murein hydrolase activator EnvC family protein n=1 Tax=Pseudoalteromonas spongiae TaxID=298657 RepID=UPI003735FA4C